eukprot:360655_1
MGNNVSKTFRPYLEGDEVAFVISKIVRDIENKYKSLDIPLAILQLIYNYYDRTIYIEQISDTEIFPAEFGYLKIVMAAKYGFSGDRVAGKTSIMRRYTENKFEDVYIISTGIDFKIKKLKVNGEYFKLQIWDECMGREKFRWPSVHWFRSAHGAFMIFDITNRESFEGIDPKLNKIETVQPDISWILIGNKIDLSDQRVVSFEEAKQYAIQKNMIYIEVSAKTGQNINKSFETMVQELYKRKRYYKKQNKSIVQKKEILLNTNKKKK